MGFSGNPDSLETTKKSKACPSQSISRHDMILQITSSQREQ
jgi:hypothetical protein